MAGKFLYFAYGSNILNERLRSENRARSATFHASGYVTGRSLTFDKASKDGSGKCDMQLTDDANDRVEGVLFWIGDADKSRLDDAEGLNCGYVETVVEVVTENNVRVRH